MIDLLVCAAWPVVMFLLLIGIAYAVDSEVTDD